MGKFMGNCKILAGGRMICVDADDLAVFVAIEKAGEIAFQGVSNNAQPAGFSDLRQGYGRVCDVVVLQKFLYHRLNFASPYRHMVLLL